VRVGKGQTFPAHCRKEVKTSTPNEERKMDETKIAQMIRITVSEPGQDGGIRIFSKSSDIDVSVQQYASYTEQVRDIEEKMNGDIAHAKYWRDKRMGDLKRQFFGSEKIQIVIAYPLEN
jgi:hypothetical protein